MKALLLTEVKKLQVVDLPEPSCGPEDIVVRVQACGICGSDIHGFDGSSGRRIPPLVMGHEAAGIVTEIGENVRGLAVGDRVTFDSTVSAKIAKSSASRAKNSAAKAPSRNLSLSR